MRSWPVQCGVVNVPPKLGENKDVNQLLPVVFKKLLYGLDGRHGIMRCVGLCRRLEYSVRMVILSHPERTVGQMSLPWDSVSVLFGDQLIKSGVCAEAVTTAQRKLASNTGNKLRQVPNSILRNKYMFAHRNPSLHRIGILAFHSAVHFDSYVLKIQSMATSHFGRISTGIRCQLCRPSATAVGQKRRPCPLGKICFLTPRES